MFKLVGINKKGGRSLTVMEEKLFLPFRSWVARDRYAAPRNSR